MPEKTDGDTKNQESKNYCNILNKEKEAIGKVPVASFIYKYLHC